jgi:pimeloyl-ACP methyl ester carboxylesterase
MCAVFVSATVSGQDLTGDWNGVLEVQNTRLSLVFHIRQAGDGYQATMDSPDQGAKDIPVTSVSYEKNVVKLSVAPIAVEYEGTLDAGGNTVAGTFRQGGQPFPLTLTKGLPDKPKAPARPQEPSKPYPYHEEEVSFDNTEAGVRLAGTLSLPEKEGVFPAVVLISGSGKQNRDEELLGHKPFLVLADYLTRNGIAVLRYDDRGAASSTGVFETATSLDFSLDAEAGVRYLLTRKEIDPHKIGLVGHSEGGMIAPMIAARSPHIAYIVLLAGPGIPGDRLLLMQQSLIGKGSGMSEEELQLAQILHRRVFDVIIQSADTAQTKAELPAAFRQLIAKYPKMKPDEITEDAYIQIQMAQLASPWLWYFIRYNPAETLEKVKVPTLAINGEKDMQVPAQVNLQAIREAFLKSGNSQLTAKELPGLNHLFQECRTGLPAEYAGIEQTFAPSALHEVLTWIKAQAESTGIH